MVVHDQVNLVSTVVAVEPEVGGGTSVQGLFAQFGDDEGLESATCEWAVIKCFPIADTGQMAHKSVIPEVQLWPLDDTLANVGVPGF